MDKNKTATIAKRVFDIFFSLTALILLSPFLLLLVILIPLTSRGNPIYSQKRIGRFGVPFKFFKFRTMHIDAEKRLQSILANNPSYKLEWDQIHKLKNDPRVTFIGAILRKTSMDELPQFINVLKGEMSVVGPRPVLHEEIVKHFGDKAKDVLSVRPGLTGLWQTSGRNNTTYAERVALDARYACSWSLKQDFKIIAKTIPAILYKNDGAF